MSVPPSFPSSTPPSDAPVPNTPSSDAPPSNARRSFLRASGLAGLLAAGAVTGSGSAVAQPAAAHPAAPRAATDPHPSGTVRRLDTVARLRELRPTAAEDGALALLAGYRARGDGGGMAVRWTASATAAHNGGTVIAPDSAPSRGRWLQLHDGAVDLRTFGHFDAGTPADDALDALVADPAVHRVEAHTDLLFRRRHLWSRSGIELDFGGHHVRTAGIEKNTRDNPFGAVFSFRGKVTDTVHRHTLGSVMPDLSDLFEVGDSAGFAVGQWWAVEVDALKGKYEKEVQRLVQVTDVVDGGHIRVAYQIGWELAAGRTLTWTRVEPVSRSHVRDLVFEGAGDDEYTGSHPVAYEYAVHCDVSGIEAAGTFWPVVMRRWCTHYRTEQCSLANPKSVTHGGAGYLTQQIYCLYGHVSDCHTSNARHLNDFTASAYCYVTNCHGDGDDQGPFVTHGQFEHDLVYTGNSGLMTFANSGTAWGGAAKRITVRRHSCSWFVARVRVTDLTLEDMTVIGKKSLDGSGMLWVNADGVQVRGCTASGPLIVSRTSSLSQRPSTISDSAFAFTKNAEITQGSVDAPLTLERTSLAGVDGARFNGTGPLVLDHCVLTASEGADPVTYRHGEVHVEGGELRDAAVRLTGSGDQLLRLAGARIGARGSGAALLSRGAGDRTVTWQLSGVDARAGGGRAHVSIGEGTNRYRASGCTFTGGTLDLRQAGFGAGGHLLHTACVEDGTARAAMPKESARVSHSKGNLSL